MASSKKSAGILLFQRQPLRVLLVHPGGPFWKHKEIGAWSIPKGEYVPGEDPLEAARREFAEETGQEVRGHLIPLDAVQLKSGKEILAWALEGVIDAEAIRSNTFPLEWPPQSGKWIDVPEVGKAGWFEPDEARTLLNPAQVAFLDRLEQILAQKP